MLLHLLGDKKDQGPQFHALNVLTLCMLVGKKAGLAERELADLAMAALAHDVGKSKVPPQLFKTSRRKRHEEEFVRQHVMYSTQLASDSGAFSKEALACIASHHEAADGSGWPRGQRETQRLALILALVNRYDNLCSPEARDVEPLMPAEALAHMFKNESGQHDPALLSSLIKLLGVYPPGTVVQLTDGALALVVAPGPEALRPQVLVYTPKSPRTRRRWWSCTPSPTSAWPKRSGRPRCLPRCSTGSIRSSGCRTSTRSRTEFFPVHYLRTVKSSLM